MTSMLLVGFVGTIVALVIMMVWSYVEISRIDEIREEVDREIEAARQAEREAE